MTATNPAQRGARQRVNKHYSPTPDPDYTPTEPGFLVSSRCGRQWFVPLEAVGRDYAEFLHHTDELEMPEALKRAEAARDFWPTWFAEQCNYWSDIERLGKLVKRSSRFKTKKALDGCRTGYVTSSNYVEVGIDSAS